jgi:hypothetical protein
MFLLKKRPLSGILPPGFPGTGRETLRNVSAHPI